MYKQWKLLKKRKITLVIKSVNFQQCRGQNEIRKKLNTLIALFKNRSWKKLEDNGSSIAKKIIK